MLGPLPEVLLTWTAHPARRRPRDVALVVAVIATTMAAVLISFEDALLAVLAGVLLVVAVAPFLLPSRYTVTSEGVEVARGFRTRSRRFADLRRLEIGETAALVSPLARPSWLDRQRGLLILFDGADREKVVSILRARTQRT